MGAWFRLPSPIEILLGVLWAIWWSFQGSPVIMLCFLVCRFSGESLTCAGDDGAVGIIFLREDITVRTKEPKWFGWRPHFNVTLLLRCCFIILNCGTMTTRLSEGIGVSTILTLRVYKKIVDVSFLLLTKARLKKECRRSSKLSLSLLSYFFFSYFCIPLLEI